jgi:hypothetical protein
MLLPIYSYEIESKFRKTLNVLLKENPWICMPSNIPNWQKLESYPEKLPQHILFTYDRGQGLGPCLLVTLENGETALHDLASTNWYAMGKSKKVVSGAIVLLVDFSRYAGDSLFGGHISVLDVLVYDNVNLVDFEIRDRFEIAKVIENCVEPSRFIIRCAKRPEDGNLDNVFNFYGLNTFSAKIL